MTQSRQLAAIMFTDIVGYTAMMQQDKEIAVEAVLKSEMVLKRLIDQYQGELLQTYGDGSLSIFNNVTGAVTCASEIQQELRGQVPLRIGIHIGEITKDDDHFFGDGVNIASRIESLGIADSVLVSAAVRQQLLNNTRFQFKSLGRYALKNVEEPMEVFALSNQGLKVPDSKVNDQASITVDGSHRKATAKIWIGSIIALLMAVLILGIINGWFKRSATGEIDKSIAVLPFVDMSTDQDQQYFSDGMAEEIINALAQIPNLKVASRTSAFQFRDRSEDIKTIAEKLDVTTVLEGSVRKYKNNVRITAQLINATNGFHIWSQTYDRELDDIFAVQEELSRSIVEALQMQISDRRLVEERTSNLEAYNFYLQGRYYLGIRSRDALESSIEYFEKAVASDRFYALAYHGMAASYMAQGVWGYQDPSITYNKSKSAVLKSLELDPDFGPSYAVLGALQVWYEWDWEAGVKSFDRCFQLAPNYVQAHLWRLNLAVITGDTATVTREINKAIQLDPASPPANWSLARYFAIRKQYDRALAQARKTLAMQSDLPIMHLTMYQIYLELNNENLAVEHFVKWRSAYDEKEAETLSTGYRQVGWKEASKIMMGMLEAKSKSEYVSPVIIALYAVHAGDFDKALDHLEAAYLKKDPGIASIGLETHWKPLLADPRFHQLLNNVEMSPIWVHQAGW